VGSSNQFAHAACLAVARHPARTYNPLFIYGDVGLGKTHLLHAIGHYVQQTHRSMVTCYVSSEKFLNDLVSALSHDKMEDFRNRYRKNDVILVDDVQFLIGKERTQEEFFHTFNVLFNDNKQIVLTSDKLPKDLVGLEKRLRSRFEWGLVADLQAPDLETKIAILTKKAEFMQMTLPDEVAWFLARRLAGDVRKLEGALNVIEAFTSMTGQQITVSLVQNLIAELADVQEERPISIADIERAVADRYKLKGALLRSKKRNKEIAHARHVAMYLARTLPVRRYRKLARILVIVTIPQSCTPATKSKAWSRKIGASRRKSSSSSGRCRDSVGSRGGVCQNRASNSRGQDYGLLLRLEWDSPLPQLLVELEEYLQQSPKFFAGAQVLLEIGGRPVLQQDMEQLAVVLSRYGVMLQGVVPDSGRSGTASPPLITPNVRALTSRCANPRPCRTAYGAFWRKSRRRRSFDRRRRCQSWGGSHCRL
jgi:hypothetical protein